MADGDAPARRGTVYEQSVAILQSQHHLPSLVVLDVECIIVKRCVELSTTMLDI